MNYRLAFFSIIFLFACQKKVVTLETVEHPLENSLEITHSYDYDSAALLNRVEVLSSDEYEGRETGTPGGELAKSFLMAEFQNAGLELLGPSFMQPFRFKDRSGKALNAANVLGRITGSEFPDSYIVVSAHYDHLGFHDGKIFNGADDDASGTSGILAVAEHFIKNPPNYSIIIAAFDAEEKGLRGAKHFVDHSIVPQQQLKLNVNLDMIGRNDQNELYIVGTSHYPQLKTTITSKLTSPTLKLLHGHDGKDGKQDWTNSSDHAPFHAKGIPFIYFGEEDHADYHKATDEFDKLQPAFYKAAVDVIIQAIEIADDQEL